MVEYIRTWSEVVVMEIAQVEVRSRAMAVEDAAGKEKRRKVGNGELRLHSSTLVQIRTEEDDLSNQCVASAGSLSSGDVPASCCSRNGSTGELKFADLEERNVESGTVARCNLDRRSSDSKSEFKEESSEPETITVKPTPVSISCRTVPVEKTPPAAELEEFFAAAEKDLHKRFKDKYNYDIVSDTPLKGRFEWIELKQRRR